MNTKISTFPPFIKRAILKGVGPKTNWIWISVLKIMTPNEDVQKTITSGGEKLHHLARNYTTWREINRVLWGTLYMRGPPISEDYPSGFISRLSAGQQRFSNPPKTSILLSSWELLDFENTLFTYTLYYLVRFVFLLFSSQKRHNNEGIVIPIFTSVGAVMNCWNGIHSNRITQKLHNREASLVFRIAFTTRNLTE